MLKKHIEICQQIKELPREKYFDIILNINNGQKSIKTFNHTTFTINSELNIKFEKKLDTQSLHFFRITYANNKYYVYHISINDLSKYIINNLDKQYIFLPISYYNKHINKGHISCLALDNHEKKAFILEPNGAHPIKITDRLFNIIIKDLSIKKLSYKYIPLKQSKSINKIYKDSNGENFGVCSTCTLFLLHKLTSLKSIVDLDTYLTTSSTDTIVNDLALFISKKFDN